VVSAQQMYDACVEYQSVHDIIIMSAAVADYTPVTKAESKIKKSENSMSIDLVKTKDILKELGANKLKNQLLIGFALETDHEIEHAQSKLKNKNLDFIVLNSLNDTGAGFGGNTNKVTIIDKDNTITNFDLKSKNEVAFDVVNYIELKLK
jgi:phosphopantothenoylcysteine decarboxylase/phosphopantothenate--cysteine ligase